MLEVFSSHRCCSDGKQLFEIISDRVVEKIE